jgi:GMP synthase-like glutamine amidotransferase
VRILVVDNNVMPSYWGARDLIRMIPRDSGATIFVRRGPQGDLPGEAQGFDRIVVSGSLTRAEDTAPWTFELENLLRDAAERGVPVLGICYGHQIIARAFGGIRSVGKARTPEHGWTRITTALDRSITRGLPKTFHSFSAHYDEVSGLPDGFECLASSEACRIQAMQHRSKPIYGLQFHPEKTAEEGRVSYEALLKKGEGKNFLNPRGGSKLYDPRIGETLFRNFISQSSAGAGK